MAKLCKVKMLDTLVTSKTRIKLLLKFFLNPNSSGYLRGLEMEFQESTNAIRTELNRFENAGMLVSSFEGNKKLYRANRDYPLYSEINSIVRKFLGIDVLIDHVLDKLGMVEKVYLLGNLAKGLDSETIELVFVGEVNLDYLNKLIVKAESLIKRKIEYVVCSEGDLNNKGWPNQFLVWQR